MITMWLVTIITVKMSRYAVLVLINPLFPILQASTYSKCRKPHALITNFEHLLKIALIKCTIWQGCISCLWQFSRNFHFWVLFLYPLARVCMLQFFRVWCSMSLHWNTFVKSHLLGFMSWLRSIKVCILLKRLALNMHL